MWTLTGHPQRWAAYMKANITNKITQCQVCHQVTAAMLFYTKFLLGHFIRWVLCQGSVNRTLWFFLLVRSFFAQGQTLSSCPQFPAFTSLVILPGAIFVKMDNRYQNSLRYEHLFQIIHSLQCLHFKKIHVLFSEATVLIVNSKVE